MDSNSLAAWSALAQRGLGHQMYTLNGSHFVTYTSSNFTTFLQQMPHETTFSFAPEVMVVLAALPLLALGMSGLTVAVFQLALAKVNRTFIDLFIAVALAFLGGLFQLFNVLSTEAQGNQFMSPTLLRLQGLALGWFVGFKFFYLYRRTQQPALNEVPRMVRVARGGRRVTQVAESEGRRNSDPGPIRTGEGPGSGGRRMSLPDQGELLSGTKAVMIHSGSYARWGTFGDVLRVFVFLFIILITFVDATWRVGFVRNVRAFRGIYSLSNGLQIALLVFFSGKLIYSAWVLEFRPRATNYVRILPLLAGMGIAFAVAVTSLVPRLLLFSETPLGRLFVLLEVFIFLLELMIRDHQKPHRDSWSFEPKLGALNDPTLARPSLAKNEPNSAALSEGFDQAQPTPVLPERIVVRHGSLVPSWLDDQRLRALPARLSSLVRPPPQSSPLAQRSSAYLVPSPGPKRALTGKDVGQEDKPVLYIRTQMLPSRPREQSPDASEGVSTMMFPESVRMSEVSVEGVVGTGSMGVSGVGEEERVLFPIEESPPPLPAAVFVGAASEFVQPVVPLAVVRQLGTKPDLARNNTGASGRTTQPSPSVYSGPNSSLGHDVPSTLPPSEPLPPQPPTKVPQVIGAFASASSLSPGSGSDPSPPGSNDSPPLPPLKARRTPTQSSASRPIILQPGDSPAPSYRNRADEVLVIHNQRPQPTPLTQHHLSIESLAAELDRGSAESGLSILSLSRFPSPPPLPQPRTGSHSSKTSHSRSIVTEGGFEFELMPPRRLGEVAERDEGMGKARETGTRAGRQALDVTSFVVGDRAGQAEARRVIQGEDGSGRRLDSLPSVDSSLPAGTPAVERPGLEASPAMSEFRIQQARTTMVPSPSSSRSRNRSDPSSGGSTPKSRPPRQSSNLVVEAQGRSIPPRSGFLARTLVSYAGTPPTQSSRRVPQPRSVLPYLPSRREPSPSVSGSEAGSTASFLLDSFASRDETPSSSVAGVPFRMFEQPRTPPLHLIRVNSDGESDGGAVESVVGSNKGGKRRREGS